MPTPLDGEALTQEIGADTLGKELNDLTNGAGIKDRADLQDMIDSIKGADVFMNRTPVD